MHTAVCSLGSQRRRSNRLLTYQPNKTGSKKPSNRTRAEPRTSDDFFRVKPATAKNVKQTNPARRRGFGTEISALDLAKTSPSNVTKTTARCSVTTGCSWGKDAK